MFTLCILFQDTSSADVKDDGSSIDTNQALLQALVTRDQTMWVMQNDK